MITGRSSGKITRKNRPSAGTAVDHRRLVELAGDRRHERPEQADGERSVNATSTRIRPGSVLNRLISCST